MYFYFLKECKTVWKYDNESLILESGELWNIKWDKINVL